jgi:hypothetical protein
MKTITATIYIASDDTEFKTEAECLHHENVIKFNELLEADEIYYNDDYDENILSDFNRFEIFVKENRDWVLENIMNIQSGDIR